MSNTMILNQSSDDSMDRILVIDESFNSDDSMEMESANHIHDQSIFHSITNNLVNDTNHDILISTIVQELIDTVVTMVSDTNIITKPICDPKDLNIFTDDIVWETESVNNITCTDDNSSNPSNPDTGSSSNELIIAEKSVELDQIKQTACDPKRFLAPSLIRLTEHEINKWTNPTVKQGIKRPFIMKIKMNHSKKRKYQNSADRPRWQCDLCDDDPYIGINSHVSRHVRNVHKSHVKFLIAYDDKKKCFLDTSLVMSMIKTTE